MHNTLPISAPISVSTDRRYRVAFVLTMLGSVHRFTLLRRFMEREKDLSCHWIPVYMWKEAQPLFRFLPHASASRIYSMLETKAIFVEKALDAVVFHAYAPHLIFTWYKWILRRRTLVVWYRDDPPIGDRMLSVLGIVTPGGLRGWVRARIWQATFTRTDLIVARCTYTKQLLVDKCGVPAERIRVLHVGVDLDRWPHIARSSRSSGQPVKILFVGGEFWRKGGDITMHVFRDYFSEQCELHLVTNQVEEVHKALGQGAPSKLGERVHVHDHVAAESAELRQLYQEADVFVLPTRADIAPFVILEAMASSLPVISTRIGGIPELMEEGVTGYLIEPNDPNGLRIAIQKLINNPQLRLRLGEAGRRRVEQSFDASVNMHQLADQIRQTVDRGRQS